MEKMLSSYVKDLEMIGASNHLIRTFKRIITTFYKWIKSEGIEEFKDVREKDIDNYTKMLLEKFTSKNTAHSLLKQLKRFYEQLQNINDFPVCNSRESVYGTLVRFSEDIIVDAKGGWKDEQMEKIVKKPDVETILGLRDRVALELTCSKTLSIQECCDLKLSDTSKSERYIKIGKDKVLHLDRMTKPWIEKYLIDSRPFIQKGFVDTGYLFITEQGKKIEEKTLKRAINDYAMKAGVSIYFKSDLQSPNVISDLAKEGFSDLLIKKIQEVEAYNAIGRCIVLSMRKLKRCKE